MANVSKIQDWLQAKEDEYMQAINKIGEYEEDLLLNGNKVLAHGMALAKQGLLSELAVIQEALNVE